ncbi:response regulator [Microvirga sp. BSC39]|uniref:response regulator n=1 Tax=Microvirga sp. BSC39 TaxID=1549810 RepID=UPI0004E8B261|nr:response regulator [Microvirga sp. BSC39]KFG70929.1 chemotaxis protein CheY [Microvirga sp. BSC39]
MPTKLSPILLVEDHPNDIELTLAAFQEARLANEILVARDGEEALKFLQQCGGDEDQGSMMPAMVILDIKMPKVDGFEVLKHIKSDPKLSHIPVVMLTSSREEVDLIRSYEQGVNSYMVKPFKAAEFFNTIQGLGFFWSLHRQTQ